MTDGRQDSGTWTGVVGDPADEDAARRYGGFIDGIDRFDARFFGMTPIGARMMDPQQRLLLETTWHALEDAGIDPESLRGSRTGVYAGVATSEYRDLMITGGARLNYLGTASSAAVGGIAFKLGLAGPTNPVMLNCAASLVTVQQAVAGLRQGEVDLALVGGVNAVLSPGLTTEMTALGMLSQRGRCRAFDAAADGFVRGEGCGMVVLKRLAEAEADGDRIWAVIRGAAVNQNGASAGPTVPNGPAQERVIEEALSQAGIRPSDVDYLEAHGAGSELGDPIEVNAAAAVYGRERSPDRPLLIGSVKTNIGHLEAAAGVASLIKVVLAMRSGAIPKNLHFENPNPHLEWDRLPVRVVSEVTDWPDTPERPASAGVSAFGISGTNAHVIVEGYGAAGRTAALPAVGQWAAGSPQRVAVDLPDAVAGQPQLDDDFAPRGVRLLPLSARSDAALRDLARGYLAWLDVRMEALAEEEAATSLLLSDMAWSAAVGRSHFECRAIAIFRDAASLRESLTALSQASVKDEAEPALRTAGKLAFLYTGQGGQWQGMGEALYAREPVVRAVLDRCDEALCEYRKASLLDVMFGRSGAAGDLDDPAWMQPATYALACALTALWSSVGVRPGAAAGHGVGMLAAAQAAGVFGLEDGLRLAAAPDDVTAPEGVTPAPPSLTLVGGSTGRLVTADEAVDGNYWRRQAAASEPEALARCASTLADLEVDTLVEVGPDAVLGPKLAAAWPERGGDDAAPTVLASLPRPSAGGTETGAGSGCEFVEAVAGVYEAGFAVSFTGLFAGEARTRIALPGYPFQRRRYWIKTPEQQDTALPS